MTPRRAQGCPRPGGPGSRSTATTSCPRRARPIPVTRPVGPPPMTATFTTTTPSHLHSGSGPAGRQAVSGRLPVRVQICGICPAAPARAHRFDRGKRGYGRRHSSSHLLGAIGTTNVTPHESHLQSDGSVFPPVTPDPPPSPGQVEIKVPDIVPVSTPDGPDRASRHPRDPGRHVRDGRCAGVVATRLTAPLGPCVRAPRRTGYLLRVRLRRSVIDKPGIRRVRRGRGFGYVDADGRTVDAATRERITALVIPPAWQDVWISPHPNGHIQAVGTDDAGRRQYLYHEAWHEDRGREKHDRVLRARAQAAGRAQADRRRPAHQRADEEARHGRRPADARRRTLPQRRRGVRGRARLSRGRDPAALTRHRQWRGRHLRVPGEVRGHPRGGHDRPAARADRAVPQAKWLSGRAAARLPRHAADGTSCGRATSTSRSRSSSARSTPSRTCARGRRP